MSFKPYYNWNTFNTKTDYFKKLELLGFKPYYNWNTFNTVRSYGVVLDDNTVLNLIITGIPSIHKGVLDLSPSEQSFKPYYNWNTFNTCKTRKGS